MTKTTTNRSNSGDAIQIGTGMGMVMMLAGIHLIDAVVAGVAVCLVIIGVMVVIRRLRN